jgi:hypothetical protein
VSYTGHPNAQKLISDTVKGPLHVRDFAYDSVFDLLPKVASDLFVDIFFSQICRQTVIISV